MMKIKRLSTLIGFAIVMTISTNLASADTASTSNQRKKTVSVELPAHYPTHFPKLGVLTEIRGQHDWVVDGIAMQVAPSVVVHSLVTNFSSLYSVKQGMELAYRVNKDGEITEIWCLPEKSIKRN